MARDFALLQIYRFNIYVINEIDCILKRVEYQLETFENFRYFSIKNGLGRFKTIYYYHFLYKP